MRLHTSVCLVIAAATLAAAIVSTVQAHRAPDSQRTLLIIHTKDLHPVAREWADYRSTNQGGNWHVALQAVLLHDDPKAQREAIRSFIRETHQIAAPVDEAHFAVLLLGDTDSVTHNGIPTWHFPQRDSVMRSRDGSNDNFATDHPYQVIGDSQDSPTIALGRIPARDTEEARAALHKIKSYEAPATIESLASASRARIAYTAGEGRFGVMDDVLETLFKSMVDRMVPDAFDLSMIYAKASSIYCPPPSALTRTVWNQLNEGSLLFNYIGHGFAQGFDALHWQNTRHQILTTSDIAQLSKKNNESSGEGLLPIAFLSCCSSGWYDLPGGQRSMAEELLFSPRGAVAVIAGSRITHPYANTLMQMNITKSLLVDRTPTVGLLDLKATQGLLKTSAIDRQLDGIAAPIARTGKWETSLADHRRMHVKLYNLIGDPATRLALPAASINSMKYKGGVVSGTVPGMMAGRVVVTAETARTSMAEPDKVQTPIGNDDPHLERKATNNVDLVNNRVLARYEGDVIDGAFEVAGDLPPSAVVLRVYAIGTDATQVVIDAAGAVRIMPITE